ncbi:MAG: SGNH/GDSL hydrolase family protein [Actinomycetota bacterium]
MALRPLLHRRPIVAVLTGLLACAAAAPALAASPAAGAVRAASARQTASAASPAQYVALGDSYSSGLGAGNMIGSSHSCDRSRVAYSALWAKANMAASYTFVACAGATTHSLLTHQVQALSRRTTLVSLTIGGNDTGFQPVLQTCILGSTRICVGAIAIAEHVAARRLPGRLHTVFGAIKAAAPAARVVVLDYPLLFDLARPACVPGLSHRDEVELNRAGNVLDGVIGAAAARSGDVFADVRGQFRHHQICDGSSWIHGIAVFNMERSFHPTAAGQRLGYLPVLSRKA